MNDKSKGKLSAEQDAEQKAQLKAELKAKVIEWITAFNAEKGWRTLRGQKNPQAGLKKSPTAQLMAEQLLDGPARAALALEIQDNKSNLAKTLDDMKTAPAGGIYDLLESHRQHYADEIADGESRLAAANKLEVRLAQLQTADANVPAELQALRDEIRAMEKTVSVDDFNPESLDQTILFSFNKEHQRISIAVDGARAEVIKITSDVKTNKRGKKSATSSYAAINDKEYKLLFGLLQKSILILQKNDLSAAMKCLAEAEAKLIEYRSARAGIAATRGQVSLLGDFDGPMTAIEMTIGRLHNRDFAAAAADKLAAEHATLADTIADFFANHSDDLKASFGSHISTFAGTATAVLDQALAIEKILLTISADVATMKANRHLQPSADAATDLANFLTATATQQDLTNAVDGAKALARTVRDRLEQAKAQDANLQNLKPAEVRAGVADLKNRYNELFKNGLVGTIKKQLLGDAGDSKTYSDLPKDALREIELQILAAEQLAESDSIDALAQADQFITETTNFLDAIKDNPKVYSDRIKAFAEVAKVISDIESRYPLYLPGERLDIGAALDVLRNTQMTRPQIDIATETAALLKKANDLRVVIQMMQTEKRALAAQADRVKELIENISERFKKDVKILGGFTGYYGPEVAELKDVRDLIAERTEKSLSKAKISLDKMENDLSVARVLLKKHKDKKQDLADGESGTLWATVAKARTGQSDHDADKAEKKNFDKRMEVLKKNLSATKDTLKSLKADVTELTSLDTERSALNAEMDKSGTYREGIEKLSGLESRAADMAADAARAKEILDANLGDAAAETVREVKSFITKLGSFVDGVIKPAGEAPAGNELDRVYDKTAIYLFFTKLAASVNSVGLDLIKTQSVVVADRSVPVDKRKLARKTALTELRKLMALFEGFEPMLHLRRHSFGKSDATTQLVTARQTLPRLEKRLLTAIKD